MLRLWQKGGVYFARHIGTDNVVIESDDWRYFSANLKLRLNHEATISQVHENTIETEHQRTAKLYANRRGRLPNENEFGTD